MITIRFKPLRSGEYSVFLDDYNKGKRQRTFLGLRVTKNYSKSRFIAKEDLSAMEKARKIAQEMSASEKVAVSPDVSKNPSLITFIERQVNKIDKKSYTCMSLIKHLQKYSCKKDIPFKIISEKWIEGFRDYLNSIMAEATINGLILKFKSLLNDALRAGYIQNNPMNETKVVQIWKDRSYLTDAEIEALLDTPIHGNQQIFQSFFFSLYTGLTLKQVSTMTWEQIGINRKNKQEIWSVKVSGCHNHAQYTNELNQQAVEILKELEPVDVSNDTANVYTNDINVKKFSRNVLTICQNHQTSILSCDYGGQWQGLMKTFVLVWPETLLL
jgi:hypothetical protein